MGFGSFLFAVLLPPIFLFMRGRIISGIFSLVFWVLAWILLISIVGAMISPFAYILSFIPAAFALRQGQVNDAAEVMAKKMVSAMQQSEAEKA